MTKEEIYKASDVLNMILDNYLQGGEAAEVVTKFEDELIKSNLTKEEPKECMYSKDSYTDEDRKVLCDGCEEDCKYNKKETVNDNCLLNEPSIPDIVDEHWWEMLGEEPVSVWHDAQIDPPQAKKKILAINEYGSCEVDYAINMALYWPKVIKWAYIDDLLKLDNSCQSCENLQEETVSEDLSEAASVYQTFHRHATPFKAYIDGANWKEQQFEKNRLKHCDALTEEQAQMESDFVVQHLKKNNRTPTFIDAIEYGIRLQKEQMMKEVKEAQVILTRITNATLAPSLSSVILDDSFKEGDKVKVILIKED